MGSFSRFRPGIFISVLLLCALSVAGAYFLGETYLKIIREGQLPGSTRVTSGEVKSVAAPEEKKDLLLEPVPLYYLQAGVYSDMEGAEEAAKPLEDLGYCPYITGQAPYRIWVGVFQERKDTEQLKEELKDRGFGSFTGSVVINGENLQYGKGREIFIKEITPVLKAYTAWLKENLALFGSAPGSPNFVKAGIQPTVLEEVYRKVQDFQKEANSNNEIMNQRFANVNKSIGDFHLQFNTFMEQNNYEEFVVLQRRLLQFIDNYLLLWQEIDNINKT